MSKNLLIPVGIFVLLSIGCLVSDINNVNTAISFITNPSATFAQFQSAMGNGFFNGFNPSILDELGIVNSVVDVPSIDLSIDAAIKMGWIRAIPSVITIIFGGLFAFGSRFTRAIKRVILMLFGISCIGFLISVGTHIIGDFNSYGLSLDLLTTTGPYTLGAICGLANRGWIINAIRRYL